MPDTNPYEMPQVSTTTTKVNRVQPNNVGLALVGISLMSLFPGKEHSLLYFLFLCIPGTVLGFVALFGKPRPISAWVTVILGTYLCLHVPTVLLAIFNAIGAD